MDEATKPKQAIRRFDVFAEYNKLKELRKGRPLDEAKGYGLWVAKVVASRRFAPSGAPKPLHREEEREGEAHEERPHVHMLGDEPQTAELFDREIVDCMGPEFYNDVFAPTIAERFGHGERYEDIRDTVRKEWKPAA